MPGNYERTHTAAEGTDAGAGEAIVFAGCSCHLHSRTFPAEPGRTLIYRLLQERDGRNSAIVAGTDDPSQPGTIFAIMTPT